MISCLSARSDRTAVRSSALMLDQRAISSSVRAQPRQKPVSVSIVHTNMHGDSMVDISMDAMWLHQRAMTSPASTAIEPICCAAPRVSPVCPPIFAMQSRAKPKSRTVTNTSALMRDRKPPEGISVRTRTASPMPEPQTTVSHCGWPALSESPPGRAEGRACQNACRRGLPLRSLSVQALHILRPPGR